MKLAITIFIIIASIFSICALVYVIVDLILELLKKREHPQRL